MKNIFWRLFICLMFFNTTAIYAQAPTPAQAAEMARRMRSMTPQQIMKYRDSIVQAMTQHQAAVLPNGNQLLMKHHYDTTRTTVSFNYTKKTTESMGGNSGTTIQTCFGKSLKAPMMYEANGHTMVQCNLNPQGANTSALDQSANGLNNSVQYMTAGQASSATDLSRQMAFSSMTVNDNSLTGGASENAHYSGNNGSTTITTLPPVVRMTFSFSYDPIQNLSTIGIGADIKIHTVSSSEGETKAKDDAMGIGITAASDPSLAKIVGAGSLQSDPNASYIKVTKTPSGFKVIYSKVQHLPESGADITETLTATIGEHEQQFEAVIKPATNYKYLKWLPKGPKVDGTDDLKGDDSSRFFVTVRDKHDSTKRYPGNYTVRWELKDVTHYKGITSNYPVYNAKQEADLKISDSLKYFFGQIFDQATVNDSSATSKAGKGDEAIIRIMCLDYGAWGKLKAIVTLDDGTELTAFPFYDKGETFITIPYDRDENKIADEWERRENILHKGYSLEWDEDVKPDNKHNGDNIPLIDEYRGYLVEDDNYKPVYKRLSPTAKELFTLGLANLTHNGESYKQDIKAGALGFGKVSQVKVYHFTNSKYGQQEDGINLTFGRWVNYNSPTNIHTHGVVIYAFDSPTVRRDGNGVLASTKPVFPASTAGYKGGQVPDDTEVIQLWTYNIAHTNDYTSKAPGWYLPRPAGNDHFNQTANLHIKHANSTFHLALDTNTFSQTVTPNVPLLISGVITFTVAHELCHATNIHHHHFDDGDAGSYAGVSTCPVKYWMNWAQEGDCADWLPLFFAGIWKPATLTTPYGAGDVMRLCTTGDNCFSQLQLKK